MVRECKEGCKDSLYSAAETGIKVGLLSRELVKIKHNGRDGIPGVFLNHISRQKTRRICQGVIHVQKKIEAKLEETK